MNYFLAQILHSASQGWLTQTNESPTTGASLTGHSDLDSLVYSEVPSKFVGKLKPLGFKSKTHFSGNGQQHYKLSLLIILKITRKHLNIVRKLQRKMEALTS